MGVFLAPELPPIPAPTLPLKGRGLFSGRLTLIRFFSAFAKATADKPGGGQGLGGRGYGLPASPEIGYGAVPMGGDGAPILPAEKPLHCPPPN
ncbi:MAG: hypothetical protein A2075_03450 [Geobacteraceae bacterium GWC2_58_44]|nr:MAG: hypothetical protein A2075_03450 [Geobacteraceae bacterium GWC2_58_44]HBG04447.1 hypothetical protein [Geobacter sp.]